MPTTEKKENIDFSGQRKELQQDITDNFDQNIDKIHDTIKNGNKEIIRSLTADQMIKLEDKYEGVLLYVFAQRIDENGTGVASDYSAMQAFYKNPQQNSKIKIDFQNCYAAEKEIGAADILPPSVRQITVTLPVTEDYGDVGSEADLKILRKRARSRKNSRTSERRLGLKGQNQSYRGFYDRQGYIPTFTGDTIEIGAKVDQEFENRFRKETPNSLGIKELDYDKYKTYEDKDHPDDGEKSDQAFINELRKSGVSDAFLQSRNILTQDQFDEIMKLSKNNGELICNLAKQLVDRDDFRGAHCWNWVEKVYRAAGLYPAKEVWRNLNYTGSRCPRDKCMSLDKLQQTLQPGDWIFLNNENPYVQGNHSGIFLGWASEGAPIAEIASCHGANQIGDIKKYNLAFEPEYERKSGLKTTPVVWIAKPIGNAHISNGNETLRDTQQLDGKEYGLDADTVSLFNTSEGSYFKKYAADFAETSRNYKIPTLVLLQTAIKEGSKGDPRKTPGTTDATGIGQMKYDTWKGFIPEGYTVDDRFNPAAQIRSMAKYLVYLKNRKQCNWSQAMVYYNTGEGGVSDSNVAVINRNPAIKKIMESDSVSYMEAARRYYGTTIEGKQIYDEIDKSLVASVGAKLLEEKKIETAGTEQNPIIDSNMNSEQAFASLFQRYPQNQKEITEVIKQQELVPVLYYGVDNKFHQGQIIVHKKLVGDIQAIFEVARTTRFPIQKVIPISRYDWDDDRSMRENNTSAFNYRKIAGSNRLSKHSFGNAMDLNPFLNPAITYKNGQIAKIEPSNAAYNTDTVGTLTASHPIVQKFRQLGWQWGGDWNNKKDYQHFEKNIS